MYWCIECNEYVVGNPHMVSFLFVSHWGTLVQSAPPETTEEDWEWIFAHEPSPEEFELIEQESQYLYG